MTTVVNNPTPTSDNSGSGFMVGIVLLVVFVAVLLYFGIPAVRNMGPLQINMPAPQVNVPAPQIVVPNNVNVETTPAK